MGLQRSRPGMLENLNSHHCWSSSPVFSFRYFVTSSLSALLSELYFQSWSSLQPIAARSKDSLFRTALVSLTAPIKLHSPSEMVKLKTGSVVEAWNGGLFVWPCPKVARNSWNSFTSHVFLCALGVECFHTVKRQ